MRARTNLAAGLLAFAVAATVVPAPAIAEDRPVLRLLGTYATGLASGDGDTTSAEVVAVAGRLLYVSNASDVSVDIVDIARPASPRLLRRVDLSGFGDEMTSVAASGPTAARRSSRWSPAAESPTRRALVVVSNEITGTVSIYTS